MTMKRVDLRRLVSALASAVVALAVATAVLIGLQSNLIGAPLSAGCGQVPDVQESTAFAPYADRISHLPGLPIRATGGSVAPGISDRASAGVAGLPMAWADVGNDGNTARYYIDRPVPNDMTAEGFYAAGGILLNQFPVDPRNPAYVTQLATELGNRVSRVQVGPYDGAVTWGDPMSNGVRPHYVSWSNGEVNNTLIADRPAREMVALARGLVC